MNSVDQSYKDFLNETKSKELDELKEIEEKIRKYNSNQNYHYLLRLLKPLRRHWF